LRLKRHATVLRIFYVKKRFSVHETQLKDKHLVEELNVKHSRNTDENIHLVELNALAFTNSAKKNKNKVSTKEQEEKNEFLGTH